MFSDIYKIKDNGMMLEVEGKVTGPSVCTFTPHVSNLEIFRFKRVIQLFDS